MDSNIGLYKKACLTRSPMPTHVCLLYEAMWVGHMTYQISRLIRLWGSDFYNLLRIDLSVYNYIYIF